MCNLVAHTNKYYLIANYLIMHTVSRRSWIQIPAWSRGFSLPFTSQSPVYNRTRLRETLNPSRRLRFSKTLGIYRLIETVETNTHTIWYNMHLWCEFWLLLLF